MNTLIFESTVTRPGQEVSVSLTAMDPLGGLYNEFGTLQFKASKGEANIVIEFLFGDAPTELTIRVASLPALSTSCLLLCGLPIAGAIADCYRKHRGNWDGFKKCMEDQGNAISASAIACILACAK